MLVHELHREYNNNSPGDRFNYLVKGTLVLHVLTYRAMIDLKFQQSWSWQQPQLLGLDGVCLHPNHLWTNPFLLSLGEKHVPLSCNSLKSVSYYAWAYLVSALSHVLQVLHILWGLRVVALLKPSRDSGTQCGSPLILMSKEPTGSNTAPRTLLGTRAL